MINASGVCPVKADEAYRQTEELRKVGTFTRVWNISKKAARNPFVTEQRAFPRRVFRYHRTEIQKPQARDKLPRQ
jgi:hypothetical protein